MDYTKTHVVFATSGSIIQFITPFNMIKVIVVVHLYKRALTKSLDIIYIGIKIQ